jgi:hypothetical protein
VPRSHTLDFRRRLQAGVAITGTVGVLLTGAAAITTPAAASPAGTIVLASGTSGTPAVILTVGASPNYVLYDTYAANGDHQLLTVPTEGGGSATTLPSSFSASGGQALDTQLVGSLITSVDDDTVLFIHADGSGAGSVAIPDDDRTLAGSADGEYVAEPGTNGEDVVSDLATSGTKTALATLPNSSEGFLDAASDESGLLVAYFDSSCEDPTEAVVFVPAGGGAIKTLRSSASCDGTSSISDLSIGGGNAAWARFDDTLNSRVIDYTSTAGGDIHSLPTDFPAGTATTADRVGFVDFDGTFTTAPIAGGAPTTATYQVSGPADFSQGLASTGGVFAYALADTSDDSGIYVTSSAASAGTKLAPDGTDPLAASEVFVAPGQVAYSDNLTPSKPIFTRSLASPDPISVGPENLVASDSTGYGISLSGSRIVYPRHTSDGDQLDLRTSDGGVTNINGLTGAPAVDGFALTATRLSGRRVLYPTTGEDSEVFEVYDDVTRSFTTTPAQGIPRPALFGNYVAWIDANGAVRREDLATGQTTTIHQIAAPPGENTFGNLALWGNTVAWSTCTIPSDGADDCIIDTGYVTAAPGQTPPAPTTFDANDGQPLALSSGYLLRVGRTSFSRARRAPLASRSRRHRSP